MLLHFQSRIYVSYKAEDSGQHLTCFPIGSNKSEVILRAGTRLARLFPIGADFCMVFLGLLAMISAPGLRKVEGIDVVGIALKDYSGASSISSVLARQSNMHCEWWPRVYRDFHLLICVFEIIFPIPHSWMNSS